MRTIGDTGRQHDSFCSDDYNDEMRMLAMNFGYLNLQQRLRIAKESQNGQWNANMIVSNSESPDSPRADNVKEEVRVPSSEHVAEIVGRQGCKIKGIRAMTNTYIKTPVRGEDPVFMVSGRAEKVADAKRQILETAEHFTKIRANRRNGAPNSRPDDVTFHVPVPMKYVGLLVGSKGATIKGIQQKTDTYIITPSREKSPVFDVRGSSSNVLHAMVLMYEHIRERTGLPIDQLVYQISLQPDCEFPFGFGQSQMVSLLTRANQTVSCAATAAVVDAASEPLAMPPSPAFSTRMPLAPPPMNIYSSDLDNAISSSLFEQATADAAAAMSDWSPCDVTRSISSLLAAPTSLKLANTTAAALRRHTSNSGSYNAASARGFAHAFDDVISGRHVGGDHELSDSGLGYSSSSAPMSEQSSPMSSADSSPLFSHGPAALLASRCLLCHVDERAMLAPCSHMPLCYACAMHYLPDHDRKCPICSKRVERVERLFV